MDQQTKAAPARDTRDYAKRTPRELAVKALVVERIYQDEKHGAGMRPLVSEARLAIQFADKLEKVKAGPQYEEQVKEIMRELGAICLRALEQHGVINRIL